MNSKKLFALGSVSLAGASAMASTDYGPAQSHIISCKYYTSGNGHHFCVIHDMEGYYLSTISYLSNCGNTVSIHYCVNGKTDYAGDAPPGEITQMVREAYYAWHVGCWNTWMFGTEHEGFASNPAWYTEAMYQSSALLQRHLCDNYGIPKDRNHVIAHGQKLVSGWCSWLAGAYPSINCYCNSHTDPGPYWDWNHFMSLIIGGTDNAAFVSQTVANATSYSPGQGFSCTWTMNNNGTTTWTANGTSGYTLNYVSGTQMGAPTINPICCNVGPGGNSSIGVGMTAPSTPGSYTIVMQMNNAAGAFFGQQVSLQINVVNPAPSITSQPSDQTKNPGQTATFTVGASGATSYQWRKNGVNLGNGGNISGATSATLTIANAQLSDAAFYSCVAANSGGSVASSAAQLVVTATASAVGTGSGLRGLYYDNTDFTALKVARVDGTINFDWGTGSPDGSIGADQYSVRWTGQVEPRYTQTYTFYTTTDDGVRLWVNGVLLIDKWIDEAPTEWSGAIALTAGQKYDVRMDYCENGGGAAAQLRWSSASQAKEIIPQTQLYRPKPILASIANQSVAVGNALTLMATTTDWDQVAGAALFEDFESYPDGSASDIIMFRKPGNSATTSSFLDSGATNYTASTGSFPGSHASSRVLKAYWSFLTGTSNPWLRLDTSNPVNRPNPIIDVTQSLWCDIYADKSLQVELGVRETNPTGNYGDNGGTTGTIEFVGATSKVGNTPNPTRTLAANTWTTLKFNLPAEPVIGFTGNGIIESTTGKGVLEHLGLVPAGGMGAYTVYLDNFTVVQNTTLTYSLDPGAPTGASIDANIGAFSWTPAPDQGPGTYNITVRVTDNGSSPRSDTKTFAVTVNAPPVITSQPASQTASPGATIVFSVTATGSAPLSYQWKLNGGNISGATASSYTLNNVQSTDAGDYSVLVSNAYGSATSSNANLAVSASNAPPSITTQPQSLTVNQGANATFSVSVVGTTPLSFQWRLNGGPISGATQASYTRTSAQPADAGDYSVVVTNAFGTETSSNATLTVNVPPSITTQPSSQTVNQGANVTFTVAATGTAPLSYQWRKNGTSISGATGTSYSLSNVQSSNAATYTVLVSNVAGSATSSNATLAVNVPPGITTQPQSQTVAAGANVTFSVTASGTAPLGYQWRENGSNISGATTSSYTRNNVQSADVGLYSVVVSNLLGTLTSAEAVLDLTSVIVFSDDFESGNLNNWTPTPTTGTTLDISNTQNHTSGGANSALVNISTDRMYHDLPFELEGHVRAIFYIYDDTPNTSNGGQNRWFGELRCYTGSGYAASGVQQVFAIGRYGVNLGTGTGTLAGQVLNYTNYQGRVLTGPNSGYFNLSIQRSVGWHKFEIDRAADGSTINFYVDGTLGGSVPAATFYTFDSAVIGSIAGGSTAGNAWFDDVVVQYYDPPTITTQPAGQTVNAGANVTFTVTATNNALTYQWRLNGINLVGATTSSLALNNVQAADAGNYTVAVANGAGVTVSSAAALLIRPVIVAQPASRTNVAGTTATFTVAANGQAPTSYQWKKGVSNLSDGGNVSGATTATLSLTGVSQTDAASYSVFISNAAGNTTSSNATLSIMDPPLITGQPASQAVGAGANVTFTVTASGSGPLNYQWQFNGADISGATGSSYTRSNVQSADSGSYLAVVSNPAGSLASDPATLSVNTPPTLSPIANRAIHAGSTLIVTNSASDPDAPPQTLNFSLDAAPTGASINPGTGDFTWSSSATDANTTPGVTVRVTDNGTPSLSDTKSFSIAVVAAPSIVSLTISNDLVTLTWSSISGHSYRLQYKANLDDPDWLDLVDVDATGSTASALDSLLTDTDQGPVTIPQRFYRILVLD